MIVLPSKKREPLSVNPRKLLIYGPPKVGKTTFVSQLEDNLILDLEKGAHMIPAMAIDVNNISELNEVGGLIYKSEKKYKYLTIDTITALEQWVEWEATEEYMRSPTGVRFNAGRSRGDWESVLSLPNGAGYYWLRLCMTRWLNKLSVISENLIIVAHLKDKFLESKKGQEVSAKDLDLTGKIRNIVAAEMDSIGYMYRQDGRLMISFKNDETIVCGSRCQHLIGVDIEADWSKIYI